MCNQWIIYDAYQADKGNRPTAANKHEKEPGVEEEPDEEEQAEKPAGEKKEHKKNEKDLK